MQGFITAYIINLKKSVKRHDYMQSILSPYSFINIHFIEAVDGRTLSEEEVEQAFDNKNTIKHYGRELNRGEIGCTLSHRKCYATLLESDAPYALILEDDIKIMRDLSIVQDINLDAIMNTQIPTILFLSGDYWYYKRRKIVSVYGAVGAYAYLINKAAAQQILSHSQPYNVADDWFCYKKWGLQYKAIYPYIIDANVDMDSFPSDVNQDQWGNEKHLMSKKAILQSYWQGCIKRLLAACGHFEAKIRVIDNKVVETR